MKSKSLLGIRFATNELAKSLFLQEHFQRRSQTVECFSEEEEEEIRRICREDGLNDAEILAVRNLAKQKRNDEAYAELSRFLKDDGCQHYYITKPVLAMCEKLKVKEPFDTEWLVSMPDGKRQLNFGDQFFRYMKIGSFIIGLSGNENNGDVPLYYSFFNMDLGRNSVSEKGLVDDYDENDTAAILDFEAGSRKLFFQLITFMELAPIEEVVLPVGGKYGVKKSADNLLNEQRFPITIVNTNWNRTIRRHGDIDVKGHLRKQAYGPGYSKRRLIIINPFTYKSFPLAAGKIRVYAGQGKKI